MQRIEAAKIDADKENREIRDGEIVTACQQACPTNAIAFGNINDKNSRVAKLKAEERDYQVLADLNTVRARPTRLASSTRIRSWPRRTRSMRPRTAKRLD